MPIDAAALEALRLLLDVAGPERVVVIGASVPIVLIDLRHGSTGGRTTRDIDAIVRATSWEEYDDLKRRRRRRPAHSPGPRRGGPPFR